MVAIKNATVNAPKGERVKAHAKRAAPSAGRSVAKTTAKRNRKSESSQPAGSKAAKSDRPKKPKLLRDSFTIPKTEYVVLEALKVRAVKAGRPAKKSELLRAGIQALAALPDLAFVSALNAVPSLKTGRPAKA